MIGRRVSVRLDQLLLYSKIHHLACISPARLLPWNSKCHAYSTDNVALSMIYLTGGKSMYETDTRDGDLPASAGMCGHLVNFINSD